MRINTRNGKIELTKQEQKELRRAAITVRTFQKFSPHKDFATTADYLEQLAESHGKPEEG